MDGARSCDGGDNELDLRGRLVVAMAGTGPHREMRYLQVGALKGGVDLVEGSRAAVDSGGVALVTAGRRSCQLAVGLEAGRGVAWNCHSKDLVEAKGEEVQRQTGHQPKKQNQV